MKPRLLDLFCGAGGAARGYQQAGFHVTGIDTTHQPRYAGDAFQQADALEVLRSGGECIREPLDTFDVIHASPPCQGYSAMSTCRPGLADTYPRLIEPIRERLQAWGGPYVIENVPGAPLRLPIELCGQMFGLDLYRHRWFESNLYLLAPLHPKHVKPASRAGHWEPGTVMSVAGHVAPIAVARAAMGIDWTNREELAEAIPPPYSECVGRQVMRAIEVAA